MSRWESRHEEVAAEFGAAVGREWFSDGYSMRRIGKVDPLNRALIARLKTARWRKRNRALLDSPAFRRAVVERVRMWVEAQRSDSAAWRAFLDRAAARSRAYRERHADDPSYWARRRAADRSKYERIKANPARYAERLARNAALKRERRRKVRESKLAPSEAAP